MSDLFRNTLIKLTFTTFDIIALMIHKKNQKVENDLIRITMFEQL